MRRSLLILLALGIGTLVTTVTAALSYFAFHGGAELVSEILFWPNTLMQSLVPLHNIGTPEHPSYEGTPVNIAAFFVSFPLGILVIPQLPTHLFVEDSIVFRPPNRPNQSLEPTVGRCKVHILIL
jgi:hypothetical protein